jgi:hypothetical protein
LPPLKPASEVKEKENPPFAGGGYNVMWCVAAIHQYVVVLLPALEKDRHP